MQRLSLTNTGGYDYNAVETYKAEIGGVGGITNARSLAGMLTPLAQNNSKLLSKDRVQRLSQLHSVPGIDKMLMLPTSFSEGFMLHMDNRNKFQGEGGYLSLAKMLLAIWKSVAITVDEFLEAVVLHLPILIKKYLLAIWLINYGGDIEFN